jgi:hypothetical protein
MHRLTLTLRGTAVLAAIGAAAALPASAATAGPATKVLTLQEPQAQVALLDVPPKSKSKVSLGDELTITSGVYGAAHHRLGVFGGQCTALGTGALTRTLFLCHAVYRLGGGQIVTAGVMTVGATDLVIVGGSGAYEGVHGTVTPGKPAKGFFEADKLTITY